MVLILLQSIYFILPAYLANLAPPLAKYFNLWPSLARPIDFNQTLKGQPLFGPTKTWRGLIIGPAVAILVAWGQKLTLVNSFFFKISLIDYDRINIFLFGALMGSGAMMGDLLNSFIKRRLGKPSGSRWIPFDQLSFILGALLFVSPIYFPSWLIILVTLIIGFLLHILFNHLGYYLKIQKRKW